MKILMIFMVILSLIIAIGMIWISFKMLKDTQEKAKIEREEKLSNKAAQDSSIDK